MGTKIFEIEIITKKDSLLKRYYAVGDNAINAFFNSKAPKEISKKKCIVYLRISLKSEAD
jgi:hypothetical protein